MNDALKLVVEDNQAKYTLPTRGVMVDVIRCQAVLPNCRDIMHLTGSNFARCDAAPVGVIVAKEPAPDKRVGAFSVCMDCHDRTAERIAEGLAPPAVAYNIVSWARWAIRQFRHDVLTADGIAPVTPQYVINILGINIPSSDGLVTIPRCLFPEDGGVSTDQKLVSLVATMQALGLFPWPATVFGGVLSMKTAKRRTDAS